MQLYEFSVIAFGLCCTLIRSNPPLVHGLPCILLLSVHWQGQMREFWRAQRGNFSNTSIGYHPRWRLRGFSASTGGAKCVNFSNTSAGYHPKWWLREVLSVCCRGQECQFLQYYCRMSSQMVAKEFHMCASRAKCVNFSSTSIGYHPKRQLKEL